MATLEISAVFKYCKQYNLQNLTAAKMALRVKYIVKGLQNQMKVQKISSCYKESPISITQRCISTTNRKYDYFFKYLYSS